MKLNVLTKRRIDQEDLYEHCGDLSKSFAVGMSKDKHQLRLCRVSIGSDVQTSSQ